MTTKEQQFEIIRPTLWQAKCVGDIKGVRVVAGPSGSIYAEIRKAGSRAFEVVHTSKNYREARDHFDKESIEYSAEKRWYISERDRERAETLYILAKTAKMDGLDPEDTATEMSVSLALLGKIAGYARHYDLPLVLREGRLLTGHNASDLDANRKIEKQDRNALVAVVCKACDVTDGDVVMGENTVVMRWAAFESLACLAGFESKQEGTDTVNTEADGE